MRQLFKKATEDADPLERVKEWTRERFKLAGDVPVLVADCLRFAGLPAARDRGRILDRGRPASPIQAVQAGQCGRGGGPSTGLDEECADRIEWDGARVLLSLTGHCLDRACLPTACAMPTLNVTRVG